MFDSTAAYLRTIVPAIRDALARPKPGHGISLTTRLYDASVGSITLHAVYHRAEASKSLVLIVHGIGGSTDTGYCRESAEAATAAGCSAVRVTLRGADGNGDDIYHAGLTDDLRAVLSMSLFRRYERVFLLGYSLGGNIALRAAADHIDPRITSVAAICPPLDLKACMENFDRKLFRLHKLFMNRGANRSYMAMVARRRGSTTLSQLRQARTCDEWNELTICRRFGFRDATDYYDSTSIARHWHRLDVPALIVAAKYDPIVPAASIEAVLRRAPGNVQAVWTDSGGHICFPKNLRFGEASGRGLANQCLAWLIRKQNQHIQENAA